MKTKAIYKRIVLKLSGEAMAGDAGFGLNPDPINDLATRVREITSMGVEVALVVGGGNIWRGGAGSQRLGIQRSNADYMGMLATVMNGLALQGALERLGVPTRVQSAIDMRPVCEPFQRQLAVQHLEEGRVVIFVAGTGNPYFTTDTVAALRAAEIEAQMMIKATQEDGVYTADPRKDASAVRFSTISYAEYLARGLKALDAAAISLCQESRIPVRVLNIRDPQAILKAIKGEDVGTLIGGE